MDWQRIAVTDGTAQHQRTPPAFAPAYFGVDELSFEQLLAMGAEFAGQIRYYNLGNEADGDWRELFHADEAVIMALIIATEPARLEAEFREIPYHRSDAVIRYLLRLAAQIDFWFRRLSACEHETAQRLAHRLETLIGDKLAPELNRLDRIAAGGAIDAGVDLAGFAGAWGRVATEDGKSVADPAPDAPSTDEIKRELSATFHTFANSIAYLQTAAAGLLPQSLESERHDPAVGLFIAFLKLFKTAQDRVNRFTPRHLDFYYRRVLGADNRPALADSCYLLLEARPGAGKLRLDRQTRFSAGKDAELNDIVYRADEALLLGDARIEALATLCLQHDPLVSPEAGLDYVARIKSERPLTGAASEPDAGSAAWALFGAGARGEPGVTASDARIGFAIASPVLLLEQGRRRIEVRFELEPSGHATLASSCASLLECESGRAFRRQFGELFALYLLRYGGGLGEPQKARLIDKAVATLPGPQADELASLLRQDWQGLFYRLFKKPLRLHLTTTDGWMELRDSILLPYDENPGDGKTGFRILFDLGHAEPPVTAYRPERHGGELDTELPVLRCELNPQAHFCAYSVFQNLLVAALEIDVEVSGNRDLQIYNQNGQLDPARPFQPFGPLPGAGAYLVFGNHEMARKRLRALTLELDWAELPGARGGFNEHYAGYADAPGNDSFEVAFSALADGRWTPVEPAARPRFKLFETRRPGNRVAAHKTLAIEDLAHIGPIDARVDAADFGFDLKSREGFYRLTLTAPDGGFGHGEYPRLLTGVLAANARKRRPDPVPNPPYTPTLNGISLGYRATATVRPARDRDCAERIFHLHPFGVETVYPPAPEQAGYLLPQYRHEGNLFIGLGADDIAGPLTLLFHLAQDKAEAFGAGDAEFDWFYLERDRWRPLAAKRILADDTHGFLASGRVTLDIPPEIGADNRVMPPGLYWLRLSVRRAAAAFPACYFVRPHALKVSRLLDPGDAGGSAELPAEPDWKTLRREPRIARVSQAFAAFGGRPAEDEAGFRRRLSERLRHKNRALLPRDYEQLVLERFPGLAKVKCFNSLSRKHFGVRPGHVLLVVVPGVAPAVGNGCERARVDAAMLDEIAGFARALCPAFVELEVINPTYEQIQVRCTVKFGDLPGEGVNLDRLDRQISDFLCPWKSPGYRARFGWSIRQRDIESHILNLGYIDFVTNFSLLHITVDRHGKYRLFDTAASAVAHEAVIRPRYPWSLAVPMESHFIEATREARSIEAEVTGIDELEVGATFIIGNDVNGEEE